MKISIISLGWLGLSLYHELEEKGFDVSGSYFNRPKGVKKEFFFDYQHNSASLPIKESDIVFFNLPPGQIKNLDLFKTFLSTYKEKRFLFISSTSVYSEQGEVDERINPLPKSPNGVFLLQCEEEVLKLKNSLIIRPGGLYGPSRHPGNFLAGKNNIPNPLSYINLISQENLIKIIMKSLLDKEVRIINAVEKKHVTKKDFYEHYAREKSLPLPHFQEQNQNEINFKKVITCYQKYQC